jgi:hypothetical protein
MIDEKDIFLNFLIRNYPIRRIKHNKKFKRAIILDKGFPRFLSDEYSVPLILIELIDILQEVFSCDEPTARIVSNRFLEEFLKTK